jgi:hypothetical protein
MSLKTSILVGAGFKPARPFPRGPRTALLRVERGTRVRPRHSERRGRTLFSVPAAAEHARPRNENSLLGVVALNRSHAAATRA